ncbi:L-amino-acid oxidase-like [Myxocyprinus asiaticus]|uniref:L-amino-acid oxidase-like n=1 Tax=Myxocyprinus asiaticus TaxID=70543 RepID=UPI002222D541|nr:L-amino-acid oxidase-like [Myxocyprinus asiaticus]XP_051520875.1 L-amino-acid oxidase-like [Myxocyprinus asiaticus]
MFKNFTMCKYLFAMMALILVLTYHVSGNSEDPLFKCLQDPDYDELLRITKQGLPPTKTPQHIIIVGGGAAGLTAAKFLEDAGHKVTIIEASKRIGGRILTYRDEKESWYAELGAMRIPNFHKILLTLANKLGLKLGTFVQEDNNTYYFINGMRHKTYTVRQNPDVLNYTLNEWEKGKNASQLLNMALGTLKDDLQKMGCKKMLQKYDPYSVKEYLVNVGNLSRGALQMIGDVLNENSFYYTALTEMLYIQSDITDNEMYYEFKGGFDSFSDAFYTVLNATILLKSKVQAISQTDNNVTVSYQDWHNPSTLTNISADYVLVTATAKATLLIDFNPPLSSLKMEALRSLHYSSSTKVVLSFSKKFWENDDGIKGGKSITDLPSRFIHYPSHGFPGISGGAVLASYTSSDEAALLQTIPDDELKALVLNDLVKIHGEHIRHLCTGGVVKKWGLDPYSHGAFAISTPFQMIDYDSSLAQHEGRIHFAGEHTARPHAWIETAMKSALRAAKNINNNVK